MTIAFDHIVSLGADCDTAQVLQEAGWHQTPSVFDWLITPWDAMMAVLADGGARLVTDFYASHGGLSAVCAHYHLIYWHEFARDRNERPVITPRAAGQARAKLLHKMARMKAACEDGGRVLFIRAGIATDGPQDRFMAGAAFSGAQLDRCASVIAGLYPALRFSVVAIYYPGRDTLCGPAPVDPRVTLVPMRLVQHKQVGRTIKAPPEDWAALLSRISYDGAQAAQQVREV